MIVTDRIEYIDLLMHTYTHNYSHRCIEHNTCFLENIKKSIPMYC